MSTTLIYIVLGVVIVGAVAYFVMNKKKAGGSGGPSIPPEGPVSPSE
jgi:LPXTG-motif cell wall-anchored protein